MNSVLISPSVLSADFTRLGDDVLAAVDAGADWLHFDVMDGRFVPNITFGPPVVAACRNLTKTPFAVHLMIVEPEKYVEQFCNAGADLLIVHAEACVHLHRTLQQIKDCGVKAGVSLNPHTPPDCLEYIVNDLAEVLVMTVNPGFGGQTFIESTVEKIAQVRQLLDTAGSGAFLAVDGGINPETAAIVTRHGANKLVAGSYLYGHSSGLARGIQSLRDACHG